MGTRGGELRFRLPLAGVIAASSILICAAPAVAAPPDRSAYVPAGLPQTVTTADFVVHYDPATPSPEPGLSIDTYAQQGAADFQESYGKQVVGGGLSPNAGLRPPKPDDDGKTDVYIAVPKDRPGMSGGIVYRDPLPWLSAYVFMTPNLTRRAFRFRAGHELIHVIQNAYSPGSGDALLEAFANWGAEWALPEIDPLDHNFSDQDRKLAPHPWLPLDCSYDEWKGSPCGNGYWQWMFVQAQVEDFGPAFVSGYYEHFAATLQGHAVPLLEHQIGVSSGGTQDLGNRFAAYARDVWDPTRWTTDSIRQLHEEYRVRPAHQVLDRASATGETSRVSIDHLAVRYVLFDNVAFGSRPGDRLELSWTRPPGMVAPVVPLVRYAGRQAWAEPAVHPGAEGAASVPIGPEVQEVLLPLVNDRPNADDQPFTYRLLVVDGPDTTPPRTSIRRRPPKRTASRIARFLFEGDEKSTYQCKLDRRRFKPCGKRARFRVKVRRHRIAVRAVDLAGNVDPTPARFSWNVVERR